VAGGTVELIRHDDLAVLASAVPRDEFSAAALQERLEDFTALAELAGAHDRVLHEAFATTDVAPLRICTLYDSRAAIRDVLRDKSVHFATLLARLHDRTEVGVKGFLVPVAGSSAPPPASGAEYLARRRAERERADDGIRAAVAAAADVHQHLSEAAAAATLSPPQDRRLSGRPEEMVLNGAYLVARAGVEGFLRAVDEQRRESRGHGLELEATGPWPPYNFASA
jgi:hypothetical protein